MLLLVLTSISVVVAARQKQRRKSQIIEFRLDYLAEGFGRKLKKLNSKINDRQTESFGSKSKNRGQLRFTLVKATGLVSNFCCFLFLYTLRKLQSQKLYSLQSFFCSKFSFSVLKMVFQLFHSIIMK
jgi:hypothetical protein